MRWRTEPVLPVRTGERILAWARIDDGTLIAGTRAALYWSQSGGQPARLSWDEIEAADWDQDTSRLRVSAIGSWGESRPEYAWTVAAPGRLLELVRERVSASVVFQQHVPVSGPRGVRVVARRDARGSEPLRWFFEYDEGIDPEDPEVQRVAHAALAAARDLVEPG